MGYCSHVAAALQSVWSIPLVQEMPMCGLRIGKNYWTKQGWTL